MSLKRLGCAAVLSVVLAACGAAPPPAPVGVEDDVGFTSVIDDAKTVANDLEQRQADIEAQLNDPFSGG